MIDRPNTRLALVIIGCALVQVTGAFAAHATVRSRGIVTAKAAILIDNQTGAVLWQRNPDLPLPPASTTKVMTALLALQSGRLDDSLSVTADAAQAPPSKINLRPGWRMRLRDLVYALLLNSANDAAVVIAEGLSGNVQDFAARMNAQARALGATNTHFVNPNGLPAENHYSTARDLATIFRHGMENPLFERIVSTKTIAVSPAAGSLRHIVLRSHNRLLGNYHIQVVGKTGWTLAAKKCFVGAAMADGRELIVAVLGSHNLWGDLKQLIEFGFRGSESPIPEAVDLELASSGSAAAVGDADADDAIGARSMLRYCVRTGTFRQLNSAVRLKSVAARSGYPAQVETIRQRRRHLYRVSMGCYPSKDAARQVADRLRRSDQRLNTIVVASS